VSGQRGKLLDTHRLGQSQLVRVMQAHRPQRNADHWRGGLQELQVRRRKAAAILALGGDARDHALALHHRHPDHVTRGRRAVSVDRGGIASDRFHD